jgi:hypothetical protein
MKNSYKNMVNEAYTDILSEKKMTTKLGVKQKEIIQDLIKNNFSDKAKMFKVDGDELKIMDADVAGQLADVLQSKYSAMFSKNQVGLTDNGTLGYYGKAK